MKALKVDRRTGKVFATKLIRKAEYITSSSTGERSIKIIFSYNATDLDRVKTLVGRQYHNEVTKYWTCPFCLSHIKKLHEWGFTLDEGLSTYLKRMSSQLKTLKDIPIPDLRKTLFPYQSIGVSFIESHDGRVLIADEMGLGKTIQVLAWLQLHPEKRPVIIVVPASLKLNWKKEAFDWMKSPRVQIISGKDTTTPIIGEIIVINYDILPAWVKILIKIKAKVLIADECHYFKNSKAKRSKAVMSLGKTIPHIIAISGTPIQNRPIEIFNSIKLIAPGMFPNYFIFGQRFCDAKNNGFGWNFNGESNTRELHQILTESIMIRRLKSDVLSDLPDKQYSFIPLELDNEAEYMKASADFLNYIKINRGEEAFARASNAEVLGRIEVLKQLAVKGKMPQAIEWIQDFLNGGGKLVVFAVHKEIIDLLYKAFPDITVKVDGSTSMKEREEAVADFQTNTAIRLFVGNIKVAGVGITLTASSNVIFLELPWTPGELSQAIDRLHRIGQKFQVFVIFLLAANTIEEQIGALIDKKREILNLLLDGGTGDDVSLITELMNSFNKQ